MSNPTYGSDPQSGVHHRGHRSVRHRSHTSTTDPYDTSVPYEPTDPNAPAAGGYATTGTYTTDTTYGTESEGGSPSTKDVAKDEAGNVKDTAVDAGKQVAGTAKEEAANVARRGQAAGQEPGEHGNVGAARSQASAQQGQLAAQPPRLRRRAAGADPGPAARGRAAERPGAAGCEQGHQVRLVAREPGAGRRAGRRPAVRPAASSDVPGPVRPGRRGRRPDHPRRGGGQHQRRLAGASPARALSDTAELRRTRPPAWTT